jgi:quercetin dioxygenase-like cupin family protein
MATGVQTDNAFTLLDQVVHDGGGGGPVTHSHAQDEGLYVISGKCTFNAGGIQGLQGTPGTFVSIPGDTEHSFTVDEPDTHVLNFYLPAGFEQLLVGISHPAEERKCPPHESIEGMMAPPWLADKLCEDYGQDNVLGNPFVQRPDPAKMMTRPTPGATIFPYIARARELSRYVTMGGCWSILASGPQTNGCYCLMEVQFRKGTTIGPRIYQDKDEMYYVFGGNMTLIMGDKVTKAKLGSLVYIPSGTVYSIRMDTDVHCLNLHTRSGFDELIEMVGTKTDEVPAVPSDDFAEKEVDAGARKRLMEKIKLLELPHLRPSFPE